MKQHPFIGICITIIVVLILASFSNVIGHKSVPSTIPNVSPLFTIRTQRATNQGREASMTSKYLGKEIESTLQFSKHNTKTEELKTISEIIKKMDDITYQRFLILLEQHLKTSITLNEKQLHEILDGFTKIRKQNAAPLLPPEQMYSLGCPPSIFDSDNILCKLYILFTLSISFIFIIVIIICHIIHPLHQEIHLFIS